MAPLSSAAIACFGDKSPLAGRNLLNSGIILKTKPSLHQESIRPEKTWRQDDPRAARDKRIKAFLNFIASNPDEPINGNLVLDKLSKNGFREDLILPCSFHNGSVNATAFARAALRRPVALVLRIDVVRHGLPSATTCVVAANAHAGGPKNSVLATRRIRFGPHPAGFGEKGCTRLVTLAEKGGWREGCSEALALALIVAEVENAFFAGRVMDAFVLDLSGLPNLGSLDADRGGTLEGAWDAWMEDKGQIEKALTAQGLGGALAAEGFGSLEEALALEGGGFPTAQVRSLCEAQASTIDEVRLAFAASRIGRPHPPFV